MASLPSVAATGTLKLEQELRKHTAILLPIEKKITQVVIQNPNLSYQGTFTKFNGSSEPKALDFREALSLIKEGTQVNSSLYLPLLQECLDHKSISETRIVHCHMVKSGAHKDKYLMTFLVNVYGKCGAMEDARKVFDEFPNRNVVTWTSLMTGYNRSSQPEIVIKIFQEMLESGSYPTNYTLGAVLSACSSLQSIELGKQIHAYSIKYHIEFDTSLGNALCSLYSKCGGLEYAEKAFRRIEEKNVISWTSIVSACGDNGEAGMGLRIFVEMLNENISPNDYTLTSVLSMCCMIHALSLGTQVHSLSLKLGYEKNIPITNSIMYLYLKCGLIDDAQILFDGMETISMITWNAMISGHAQMTDCSTDDLSAYHSGTKALHVFLQMNRSGLKPDLYTLSSVLTLCSKLSALEQGEQLHAQTIKTGFLSDNVVGTALVNMYNKCGSIDKASKAFVEMPLRTLISWTSMITGFAQHGLSKQALNLFEDMRFVGVRPNKITFVGVLSACSHAGLVDEALFYFEMMKNDYKIKPVMDHYACIIDMYVRLGKLDEAFDFVKKMDFEPSEIIWSILIAGCRSHGNLELGFYAAEELLKLKPKDTETYVMLLNMYLTAERYPEVSRIRKLMKEENLGKLKDWSWISIKEKVFSFKSGSLENSQSAQMYALLDDLLEKAKKIGYESLPNIANEDENEKIFHSEKLAIAFGLLNTPDESPIRLVKSISMCRDCHGFIKFISLLTNREIIVRDSKRLHKFVNGQCSCGDFSALI